MMTHFSCQATAAAVVSCEYSADNHRHPVT